MRKRTVKNVANNIFWYIIYTLPIIMWIFYLMWGMYNGFGLGLQDNGADILNSFVEVIESGLLVDFFETDPITQAIGDVVFMLLGETMPNHVLFAVVCLGWFVNAHIIHIFIDAILFIPRLAHKWMEKCTVEE